MRVFAVFSHQSLSLSLSLSVSLAPSLLQAWGRCTKAAALSAYALHKRGFCGVSGTRDPQRQTGRETDSSTYWSRWSWGWGLLRKAPREPRLFLSRLIRWRTHTHTHTHPILHHVHKSKSGQLNPGRDLDVKLLGF